MKLNIFFTLSLSWVVPNFPELHLDGASASQHVERCQPPCLFFSTATSGVAILRSQKLIIKSTPDSKLYIYLLDLTARDHRYWSLNS